MLASLITYLFFRQLRRRQLVGVPIVQAKILLRFPLLVRSSCDSPVMFGVAEPVSGTTPNANGADLSSELFHRLLSSGCGFFEKRLSQLQRVQQYACPNFARLLPSLQVQFLENDSSEREGCWIFGPSTLHKCIVSRKILGSTGHGHIRGAIKVKTRISTEQQ